MEFFTIVRELSECADGVLPDLAAAITGPITRADNVKTTPWYDLSIVLICVH